MSYQPVQKFNGNMYGSPEYKGIEYDWEVPNSQIITSPGGTSSTHHHWTKGFYGPGGSSGDIYAGSGDPYLYGNYGSLYQQGDTATYDLGIFRNDTDDSPIEFIDASPDLNPAYLDFDSLDPPPKEIYTSPPNYTSKVQARSRPPYGRSPRILPKEEESIREGFVYGTPIEEEETIIESKKRSIWVYLILFALFYFAVDSWSKAGNLYLAEKFGMLDWKKQLVLAAILTFALVASGIFFKIPEEI